MLNHRPGPQVDLLLLLDSLVVASWTPKQKVMTLNPTVSAVQLHSKPKIPQSLTAVIHSKSLDKCIGSTMHHTFLSLNFEQNTQMREGINKTTFECMCDYVTIADG